MSFKFLFAKKRKKIHKRKTKKSKSKKETENYTRNENNFIVLYITAISSVSVMKINKNEYDKEK